MQDISIVTWFCCNSKCFFLEEDFFNFPDDDAGNIWNRELLDIADPII